MSFTQLLAAIVLLVAAGFLIAAFFFGPKTLSPTQRWIVVLFGALLCGLSAGLMTGDIAVRTRLADSPLGEVTVAATAGCGVFLVVLVLGLRAVGGRAGARGGGAGAGAARARPGGSGGLRGLGAAPEAGGATAATGDVLSGPLTPSGVPGAGTPLLHAAPASTEDARPEPLGLLVAAPRALAAVPAGEPGVSGSPRSRRALIAAVLVGVVAAGLLGTRLELGRENADLLADELARKDVSAYRLARLAESQAGGGDEYSRFLKTMADRMVEDSRGGRPVESPSVRAVSAAEEKYGRNDPEAGKVLSRYVKTLRDPDEAKRLKDRAAAAGIRMPVQ